MWLHGLMNGRYLVEITEDGAQEDSWDVVNTAVLRTLFS